MEEAEKILEEIAQKDKKKGKLNQEEIERIARDIISKG